MHAPKGFGKRYFTLSAIQAYAGSITLQRRASSTQAHHRRVGEECDEEALTDEDELLLLEETASAVLPGGRHRPCHCNRFFHRRTCAKLRTHNLPKRSVSPYRLTRSTLSPPKQAFCFTRYDSYIQRNPVKKTVLSLAALSALAGTLAASSVTLEALTVTSTPLGNTELDAPDSVEVYTADDIEKAHVQSLYEFITLQTSVIAMPSYGNPMAQKLDLHGYGIENGYQNIVITVNGRRLNNVDMVPQLLSSIAPADIDRLEIIKSGGVVLGGDGANAGVINIVTKKDDSKAVSFYGGVYNTYDVAFRVGHSDELFSVSASGEAYHTAGTRHIDAQQNRDAQKLANGTFDLSITPTDAVELRLGAQSARTDVNYGGPMTQSEYDENPAQPGSGYGWGPAPSHQRFDSDAYSTGVTYDVNDRWSLNLDGYLEKKKSNYVTYGSVYNYDYRTAKATVD
ncbi:MAG: TonB-dependent receptor plug domain-containing protein, partial [Campylobacterales bacterium]